MWLCLSVLFFVCVSTQTCQNGYSFPDRAGECECFTCWEGPSCSSPIRGCALSCETNEGYVQTEYWMNVAKGFPETDILSSYRTDYLDPQVWHPGQPDPPEGIFGALREQIIRAHELVGNVQDIRGKSLIIGHGATQLINAAIDAYAKRAGRQVVVTATRPYYYLVPGVVYVSAGGSTFAPADSLSLTENPVGSLTEVITVPRNPDGATNSTPFTKTANLVYDNVFYWPSFLEAEEIVPLDVPISLFSLSKLSGLSGSRLGWAFVKDPIIADLMGDYIYYSTHGVSVDAQYRAVNTLKVIADDNGKIFSYVNSTLEDRWSWIISAFEGQSHYEVAGARGFPVLWINCLDFLATEGCDNVFYMGGIRVRAGVEFGTPGFVRLNMMVHEETWTEVQDRLNVLLKTPKQKMSKMIAQAKEKGSQIPRFSS